MAFKRFLLAKAFDGVAPNARATCELTLGPRYHAVRIYGNDPNDATKKIADIVEEVRVLLGNQPQRIFTPAELHTMNVRFGSIYGNVDVGDAIGGANTTEFELPVFLSEPWRKNQKLSELFAWPTGLYPNGNKSVQSFVIQVKLKNTAPATSKLYAVVEVDDSFVDNGKGGLIDAPIGLIVKWERKDIPYVGAQLDIENLEIKEVLQGITLFDADITAIELYANDALLWEVTKERANRILRQHEMTPDDTKFQMVFDYADPVQDGLVMADQNGNPLRKFKLRIKSSNVAARTITAMIERYGKPV